VSSSISDPVPDDMPPEQLRHILNYWRVEAIHAQEVCRRLENDVMSLRQDKAVLEAKLGWLRLAEHLLIWDGAAWKVRPEHLPR